MNKVLIIGIFVAVIIIAGIFVFKNIKQTENPISKVKEITLKAIRFQYSPDTIIVNNGDKVRIIIDNIDTLHGIRIPEFNVQGENSVEFVANKTGEFDFYCNVFCGDKHREMKGRLIIK